MRQMKIFCWYHWSCPQDILKICTWYFTNLRLKTEQVIPNIIWYFCTKCYIPYHSTRWWQNALDKQQAMCIEPACLPLRYRVPPRRAVWNATDEDFLLAPLKDEPKRLWRSPITEPIITTNNIKRPPIWKRTEVHGSNHLGHKSWTKGGPWPTAQTVVDLCNSDNKVSKISNYPGAWKTGAV